MKPILRWPGGKSRHLKTLLPLITPHTCYVEVFAGGLALLLAKERSKVEVVNDINRDLVALYRCAQYHCDALLDELQFALSARANFADYPSNKGLTDLQRAARFLVLNRTSFAGSGTSFAIQRKSGGGATLSKSGLLDALQLLNTRLERVAVECIDWEHCLNLYDAQETFFFLDPPYLNAQIRAYAGWPEAEMIRLADALKRLKGQWLLTVDGSEFCQEVFAQWHVRKIETQNRAVNQRLHGGAMFSELIITPHPA